ncbi:MAG: hypothetical protein R2795_27365 [Saprospiraceae bacterium]
MAKAQQVVTQMGNQGASNPLLNLVQGWIDAGRLGKISKVQIYQSPGLATRNRNARA